MNYCENKAVPEQYRLLKDIELISEAIYYEETDSTNTQAVKAFASGQGTLVYADRQSAGRGRRGRTWESEPGSNIYMSLCLKPEIAPDKAPMLTLVMAAAVAAGIEEVQKKTGMTETEMCAPNDKIADVQTGLGIKWPNDIVLNGRKICGILTEMSVESGQIEYVVIGVGINVNQETFPEELKVSATSLKNEMKTAFSRAEIMTAVLEKFAIYYRRFLADEDLSGILESYNHILVNRGREVRILEPGNEYQARALGINEVGELIVELPEGERRNIYAGEVSVRGLYGYM